MTNDVSDVVRELRERLAKIQAAGGSVGASAKGGDQPTPESGRSRDDAAHAARDAESYAELDGTQREEEQLAKAICLRLLADSARPRAGLEQKLLRRGISPAVVTRVLDRFTEVGLIDDQAYAEAFVRTKHQERALSRHALAAELRRKGIDDSITDVALAEVDSATEESRAVALIAKRVQTASAAGPESARRRLLALLARRGYPAEMSIRVVNDALSRHLDGADN